MDTKLINPRQVKDKMDPLNKNNLTVNETIKMQLMQTLAFNVLDNLPENPDSLLVMFPWITPWFPYADGWICKHKDWKMEWFDTYKDNWISPFTEELWKKYWWKNPWILQFNYPNGKNNLFNFSKFVSKVIDYIKLEKEKRQYNNINNITLYWQSMGAKVVLESVPEFVKSWFNINNIVLYAPALTPDFYPFPANKLNKVPLSLATFVQKCFFGIMVDYLISKKDQYNWWVELSKKDLSKLAKEVAWYKVLWDQMKERLRFLANPDYSYINTIKELDPPPKIIVMVSHLPNKRDDGIIVLDKVKKFFEKNFPNSVLSIIDWLPHVQTPQSPYLHARILDEIK